MRNYFFILIFISLFFSCSTSSEEEKKIEQITKSVEPVKTKFEMYQASEMTALMEFMYSNNQLIKEKILNEDFDFGKFPEEYLTIFTAELTDSTDRDDFLMEQAHFFIEAQKRVHENPESSLRNFNVMVDACIQCHQIKCSGPIERIEKLYLKD